MTGLYESKVYTLQRRFHELESAVVAFSGGVDSSVLVAVAHQELGPKMMAATSVSASLPRVDAQIAAGLCKDRGIPHRFVDTFEFDDNDFTANPEDRCYYCKQHLYKGLTSLADELSFRYVVEGTNVSDLAGHRPGFRASKENPRVVTPLVEAGLDKAFVRRLAAELGLITADKPAAACLSSRIPTGVQLEPQILARIDAAEDILRRIGVRQVRVRHHDDLARIEVEAQDLELCLARRDEVSQSLKELGWKFVTLDLVGYRTGGMRE